MRLLACCALLLAWTASAIGADSAPVELVRKTSSETMEAVEQHRDTYDQNPGPLRDKLERILAPHIAFRSIARGVVGPYRESLSPEQFRRFRGTFETTLLNLYADALVALEPRDIEVLPLEEEPGDRARVTMHVTTKAGEQVTVFYAMGHTDRWQVYNAMVGGINLGRTYRHQFQALMQEHEGDIDTVLSAWADVAAKATEVEVQKH